VIPTVVSPVYQMALVLGGLAVLAWRIRETRVPVTTRTLLLPPLGMSTGFSMFLVPSVRIPLSWAAASFMAGWLVLSLPLVRSSSLERRGEEVLMRRSNVFFVILLGLLALRLALHHYVGRLISPPQTAGVLFVLAFGMIARWRGTLYNDFRALANGS
jgi:membrane protein CcdC involved in cytochrome C biogenesis